MLPVRLWTVRLSLTFLSLLDLHSLTESECSHSNSVVFRTFSSVQMAQIGFGIFQSTVAEVAVVARSSVQSTMHRNKNQNRMQIQRIAYASLVTSDTFPTFTSSSTGASLGFSISVATGFSTRVTGKRERERRAQEGELSDEQTSQRARFTSLVFLSLARLLFVLRLIPGTSKGDIVDFL